MTGTMTSTGRPTMTGAEHDVYLADIATVIDLVTTTRAAARHNAPQTSAADRRPLPGWLFAVHDALLTDVNARRGPRGLPPVTMDEIVEIDRRATGADWTREVAMYAVDLTWGLD